VQLWPVKPFTPTMDGQAIVTPPGLAELVVVSICTMAVKPAGSINMYAPGVFDCRTRPGPTRDDPSGSGSCPIPPSENCPDSEPRVTMRVQPFVECASLLRASSRGRRRAREDERSSRFDPM
jgi:hypothetical protein